MTELRRATRDDVAGLAAMFGRAFSDDPVQEWMFPDEARRPAHTERIFELVLRSFHIDHGEVWTTDGLVGAAAWDPPDRWRIPAAQQLRHLPALVRMFGRRLPVALRGLRLIEAAHPRQPHWYLAILGTDPVHQGKGIGSALLAPVLERCDEEGLPAYLESSKERNVPFYARHGFRVTQELSLPDGPPVWLMWREPRERE